MQKVKIRKIYDEHSRVTFETQGPSLTVQDCKDECDINYIIESYVKRGIMPPQGGSYIDCTTVQDYETACQLVAECKTNFETLPLKYREEFKTVENYLAYISNQDNLKDCLDKGLIDKATVPEELLTEIYKETSKNVTTPQPLPVVDTAQTQSTAVSEEFSANS